MRLPQKAMKNTSPPILVSGAHRTGTTWVGKMLAAGGEATYISEPLNVWHRPGVFRPKVGTWYLYICPENEASYLQGMDELLDFRYHTWLELASLRSVKDVLRMGRDWANFFHGRLAGLRPLVKDPFAVFSIPWLMERFDFQALVTIRHPAGFVSSLKRLGWDFDFCNLVEQPLLMRDWLVPYRAEIEDIRQKPDDIVAQGSLLWRLIYQVVGAYQVNYSNLLVVRHEDLSREPLEGFQSLYAVLGLNFNSKARQAIQSSSQAENPTELSPGKEHAVKLDSRSNLANWKRRLTPSEIEHIHQLTGDVAANYYPDDEWD
jgi:hypothetical protein